ncbi:recombinase family protein [Clostridium felsineum]|uniref:Recombinase domain-containing protein n=1 Tax=Clostridium felsineum TaxID=36839 RepID=A0A1S8L3K3_9CLOT|nr:hypothetical protein [Clostridium felsineum]URZ08946.1 hypothetical protein CLROS_043500 [Clostridium felsineum]URZ09574.1 hypothetical protein CROST_002550 [Clostridium felsineum]
MNVEVLKKQMEEIKNSIKFIQNNKIKAGDSVETIIFKKYLELESTKKVTEYINELGYRKETSNKQGVNERKYITKDISNILKDKNVKVEARLKTYVIKLFNENKRGGFN